MNKKLLIAAGVAGFLAFLALLTFQMVGNRKNRVEVCVTFNGRTACGIASGSTQDAAIKTATDTACSSVAFGMTDTMTCSHNTPTSVKPLN